MRTRHSERGTAMLIALVIIIIVMGVGGAFIAETMIRGSQQHKAIQSDEAQIIVDANFDKVRRALWKYRNDNTWAWNDILAYCNGMSIDLGDVKKLYLGVKDTKAFQLYSQSSSNEAPLGLTSPSTPTTSDDVFIGWNRPFGEGAYHIVVQDNDDGDGNLFVDSDKMVIVIVTATLPDGTQRQQESLVEFVEATYSPEGALVTDGDGLLNNLTTINGTKGKVHANGDLFVKGTPNVAISGDAAGTVINPSGGPLPTPPPGGWNTGAPNVPIPDVDPADPFYRDQATFELLSTGPNAGKIYNKATSSYITPGTAGFEDLNFVAGAWKIQGNNAGTPGAYWVEGNFAAAGTGTQPTRQMTIIATGNITTGGNVKFTPYLTNTLLISGGDSQIGGTSGSLFEGIIYAREQVSVQGNASVRGSVVSKNAPDVNGLVKTGNTLGEDATTGTSTSITYNGLGTIIKNTQDSLVIRSVRRLK